MRDVLGEALSLIRDDMELSIKIYTHKMGLHWFICWSWLVRKSNLVYLCCKVKHFLKFGSSIGYYCLRFPAMGVEDFADEVAKSGLLTLQQTTDLFMYFTARVKPHLSYPVEPRRGLHMQAVHRFQSCAYRSNQWRYRGRWLTFKIKSPQNELFVSIVYSHSSYLGRPRPQLVKLRSSKIQQNHSYNRILHPAFHSFYCAGATPSSSRWIDGFS